MPEIFFERVDCFAHNQLSFFSGGKIRALLLRSSVVNRLVHSLACSCAKHGFCTPKDKKQQAPRALLLRGSVTDRKSAPSLLVAKHGFYTPKDKKKQVPRALLLCGSVTDRKSAPIGARAKSVHV